jgi:hypothetical protein
VNADVADTGIRQGPTVDLTLGGDSRGELAEMLLDVLPA